MQPAISFKETSVSPVSLKNVVISWKLHLTAESLDNYSINIYRSGSASEPKFEPVVTGLPGNSVSFMDTLDRQLMHKIYSPCWVIEVVKNDGTFKKSSSALEIQEDCDIIGLAIINKAWLALTNKYKGIGIKAWLFNIKTWGKHCPNCWDELKSKSKLSNCPKCFGTTYEGGYYKPSPIYINVSPDQRNLRLAEIGSRESVNVQAWTIAVPKVGPNDVVVIHNTNNRYKVLDVKDTVRRATVLRQILIMSEINHNNIEYELAKPAEHNMSQIKGV